MALGLSVVLLLIASSLVSQPAEAQTARSAIFPAVADANIQENNPASNFGRNHTLELRSVTSPESFAHHALIRWDVTNLTPGSTILDATATFFITDVHVDSGQIDSVEITLQIVNTGWTEGTVTWDTDPETGPAGGNTTDLSATSADEGTFIQFNVTDFVDRWVNDELVWPNHGVRIYFSITSNNTQYDLASREHSNKNHRPFLTVSFLPGGTTFDATTHPLAPHILNLGLPVNITLVILGIMILFAPLAVVTMLTGNPKNEELLPVVLMATSANIFLRFWPPILIIFLGLLTGWMLTDLIPNRQPGGVPRGD